MAELGMFPQRGFVVKFCQAQKLKHYPLVLVVVLSLVPGALGCPGFVVSSGELT